jgi:hypothetical protein
MAKFELAEFKKVHEELNQSLQRMQKENNELVEPILNNLKTEIISLTKQISDSDETEIKEIQQKNKLIERMNELLILKESQMKEYSELLIQLEKARAEPDRLTRQAESIEKASIGFDQELKIIQRKIKFNEIELNKKLIKINESLKLKENLLEKLEYHQQTLLQRENDLNIIRKQLEHEKLLNHEILLKKVEYNLKVKEIDSEVRHKNDEINLIKKEYELLKRQYKKKRGIVDQIKSIIPQLQEQTLTQEHMMRSYKEECEGIKKRIANQQEEVELGIAQLLQQENHEKSHSEVSLTPPLPPALPHFILLSYPLHSPPPFPRLSLVSVGTPPSDKRSRSFRK